ncbi:MAG: hypothetical protein JRH15_07690, partial [Deltaproteobacteria bacterium]|nr:hypothetical protein [Deltaproteobacteria bacterium]
TVLNQQLQSEFAALCNRIISAEQKKIQDRSELKTVVQKACGYLNIGIETYADMTDPASRQKTALMTGLLENAPLADIFRFGYVQALDLKFRAQRWRESAWFQKNRLPMTFWGEAWVGVLGGLVLAKPLYYDNYESGDSLYREFRSSADIAASERVLDEMMAFDALLADMAIGKPPKKIEGHHLTYKSLVLTLWAWEAMGPPDGRQSVAIEPISLDSFRLFLISLFDEPHANGDPESSPKASQNAKTRFLNWLSRCANERPETISERLGPCLTRMFAEVESELGLVSADDLDPRYVQLFWIK